MDLHSSLNSFSLPFVIVFFSLKYIYIYSVFVFCTTGSIIYTCMYVYPFPSTRNIFDEYNNSLNHARRLSVVLDLHIAGKPCPLDLIGEEEVKTYLRWLTHLFHTTKQVTAFITVSI